MVVCGAGIPRIVAQTRIEATLFLGAVVLTVAAAALTVGAMLRDAAVTVGGAGVAAVATLVFGGAEVLAVVALSHDGFLLYVLFLGGSRHLRNEGCVGAVDDYVTALDISPVFG